MERFSSEMGDNHQLKSSTLSYIDGIITASFTLQNGFSLTFTNTNRVLNPKSNANTIVIGNTIGKVDRGLV